MRKLRDSKPFKSEMNKPSPLIWLIIILIFLLPTTAGRFILDVAGGLMFAALLLPILLGGIGWISWRILQARMVKCEVCGISTFKNSNECPICGSSFPSGSNDQNASNKANEFIPASAATIDIIAEDANSDE